MVEQVDVDVGDVCSDNQQWLDQLGEWYGVVIVLVKYCYCDGQDVDDEGGGCNVSQLYVKCYENEVNQIVVVGLYDQCQVIGVGNFVGNVGKDWSSGNGCDDVVGEVVVEGQFLW